VVKEAGLRSAVVIRVGSIPTPRIDIFIKQLSKEELR